jgi:hypothetical protein
MYGVASPEMPTAYVKKKETGIIVLSEKAFAGMQAANQNT